MKKIILVLVDRALVEFVDPHNVYVPEAAEPIDLRKIRKAERADAKLVNRLMAAMQERDDLDERLRKELLAASIGTRVFQWYEGRDPLTLFDTAQTEA